MEKEDKDKFQRNLTEIAMIDESNFIWCPHGVNIFIYFY